jgi:hypothetical protein
MVSAGSFAGSLESNLVWRENCGINWLTRCGVSRFIYTCVWNCKYSRKPMISKEIQGFLMPNVYRRAIFLPQVLRHTLS